jgi:hypothetical protein
VIRKNIRSWLETRAALRDFKEPSEQAANDWERSVGAVAAMPILGGLHHQYVRL